MNKNRAVNLLSLLKLAFNVAGGRNVCIMPAVVSVKKEISAYICLWGSRSGPNNGVVCRSRCDKSKV